MEDWKNSFGDIDYSVKVGVHLGCEVLDSDVFDGYCVGVSGIVDDDIYSSKIFLACFDDFDDFFVVRDVQSERENFGAVLLNERVELGWLAAGRDD